MWRMCRPGKQKTPGPAQPYRLALPGVPGQLLEIFLRDAWSIKFSRKESNPDDMTVAAASYEKRLLKMKERYIDKAAYFELNIKNPRDANPVVYDGREDPIRSS